MAQPTIEAELQTFIIDEFLFGQASEIAPDDSLLERGIIDSTGMLELVSFLEEKFQISMDESELVRDNLDSITKLAAFVRRKKQATVVPCATPRAESAVASEAPRAEPAPAVASEAPRAEPAPAVASEALCAAAGPGELATAPPLSAGQASPGHGEPPR